MTRTHPDQSLDTLISLIILSIRWKFLAFPFLTTQHHSFLRYTLESLENARGKILSENRGFKVTMNHSKAKMVILIPTTRKLNSIEIFLHSSVLISTCKRKLLSVDLLHSTLTLSTVIFWTRRKTFKWGAPPSVFGCFDIAESLFQKVT